MPITVDIYSKHRFALITWTGNIGDDDMLGSYIALYENPNYRPEFHELVDLRKADFKELTIDGIRQLIPEVSKYNADERVQLKPLLLPSQICHLD